MRHIHVLKSSAPYYGLTLVIPWSTCLSRCAWYSRQVFLSH